MSQMLDYLSEDETAVVFDIDGVLAVYEFGLSHNACPDEEWERYIRENDPYAGMAPVEQFRRFIERKRPDRVFACSVAGEFEDECKRRFVLDNYAIPEDNIYLVDSKDKKLDVLYKVQERLGLPQRRVALVEDTVKTLNHVYDNSSFTTVHVSSFFAYE